MNALIESLGYTDLQPLAGDMSPRKYYRGIKDGRPGIVMVYPDVTDEARAELKNFICMGEYFQAQGLKAPALYALDEDLLCAQFEDLGSETFGDLLRSGQDMTECYALACDVLKHLKTCAPPEGLAQYTDSHIHYKRRQLVQYYMPLVRGQPCTDADIRGYLKVWEDIEAGLDPCPQGVLHMDYHLENLVWVGQEEGLKRCGLLDYQDAVVGPLPYDLLNLLEDARVDVPEDLRVSLIDRYCEGMSAAEQENFKSWYRVLATQFHGRVIGLFIYQAAENSRDDYLPHIPRLQNYIAKALADPLLAPLKAWFDAEGVDFSPLKDLNGERIRNSFASLKG